MPSEYRYAKATELRDMLKLSREEYNAIVERDYSWNCSRGIVTMSFESMRSALIEEVNRRMSVENAVDMLVKLERLKDEDEDEDEY